MKRREVNGRIWNLSAKILGYKIFDREHFENPENRTNNGKSITIPDEWR